MKKQSQKVFHGFVRPSLGKFEKYLHTYLFAKMASQLVLAEWQKLIANFVSFAYDFHGGLDKSIFYSTKAF